MNLWIFSSQMRTETKHKKQQILWHPVKHKNVQINCFLRTNLCIICTKSSLRNVSHEEFKYNGWKKIIQTNHYYCSQWENTPTPNLLLHPVIFSNTLSSCLQTTELKSRHNCINSLIEATIFCAVWFLCSFITFLSFIITSVSNVKLFNIALV